MDNIDKKILEIMSKDASTPSTEISSAVGLSLPATNKRIAKLRSEGIIRTQTVVTDPKRVGKPIAAFLLIVMKYGEHISEFLSSIKEDRDILECYAVTGEYDYLLKIYASSVEDLEQKLIKIKRQKGVLKSHTMLALEEHKFSAAVLPDDEVEK